MEKQRLPKDSTHFAGLSVPFLGELPGVARSLTFGRAKQWLAERRVLIVGDDVENGGRAFVSLTHAGARARLVRRRDQLAIYLDEVRPDIVIIDCDDLSGGNTAIVRQLRCDPRTALAAMVGLSRQPSRGQRGRILAAGADDLLPKPVDARLFAQQLVEALSRPGVRP
jgi:DNA-binding response OmpR family regulator